MKVIVVLSLAVLVGLSFFVSAYYDSTNEKLVINIYKGWNLIPYSAEQLDPPDNGDVLNFKDAQYIFLYDREMKKYELLWNEGHGIQRVDETSPWKFHSLVWAYYEEEGTLNLDWKNHQKDLFSLSNSKLPWDLKQGWNFVFNTPEFQDKKIREIMGTCTIEKIYVWNSEFQRWVTEKDLMNSYIPTELIGQGMVMKVAGDCKLGESGTVTAPPQIPENSNGCIDSDKGENYQIKGYVTTRDNSGKETRGDDSCVISIWNTERNWWEYKDIKSCSASTNNDASNSKAERCLVNDLVCPSSGEGFSIKLKYCPHGCTDGVCSAVEDLK